MELAQQLQEYERYRQVALQLAEAEAETLHTWLRPAKLVEEFEGEATVEADLFALLTAFKRMLDALEKDEAAAIRREKISLLDRIHWLLDKFKGTPRLSFTGLFEGVTSRSELIVTFLALLELVRLRAVGAVQTERFGEIEIRVLEDVDQIELNTERFLNA